MSISPDPRSMFLTHYLELVKLARLLVDDRESAEDVVQDVFAAMQRRWRDFDDDAAALRYLRRAVVNGSRSVLRRHRRWRTLVLPHLSEVGSAEEHALTRAGHARMQAAVARLPRRQREVIVLRYYEELSVAEVSRLLRISQGAVKASTNRALTSLRVQIRTLP